MKRPASLALTLPLPPGVNNQYVTVGKRRVLSKPAQAFKRDVTKLLAGMRERGQLDPVVEQAFGASLIGAYFTFYFETPMRRDLDGGLKIALDALGKGLGFDDRSVVDMHLTKQIDPLHPRLEVELETILDWSFDKEYVYLGESGREDADAPAE
ncbi:MAG: RusA family crossover junction endodeoxyribonuclease [Thermomicrobiales bacterium]